MDTHHTAQADGIGIIPPERRVIGTLVTKPNGLPQWQDKALWSRPDRPYLRPLPNGADRGECPECDDRADRFCKACLGTGKQLTREDYLTLAADDDDSFTETDIGRDVEDAY